MANIATIITISTSIAIGLHKDWAQSSAEGSRVQFSSWAWVSIHFAEFACHERRSGAIVIKVIVIEDYSHKLLPSPHVSPSSLGLERLQSTKALPLGCKFHGVSKLACSCVCGHVSLSSFRWMLITTTGRGLGIGVEGEDKFLCCRDAGWLRPLLWRLAATATTDKLASSLGLMAAHHSLK